MKIDTTQSRCYTNAILEMIDEGLLDAKFVSLCCLKYMSEDDVQEMARIYQMIQTRMKQSIQTTAWNDYTKTLP